MPRTMEEIAALVTKALAAAPHATHGMTAIAVAGGEATL